MIESNAVNLANPTDSADREYGYAKMGDSASTDYATNADEINSGPVDMNPSAQYETETIQQQYNDETNYPNQQYEYDQNVYEVSNIS